MLLIIIICMIHTVNHAINFYPRLTNDSFIVNLVCGTRCACAHRTLASSLYFDPHGISVGSIDRIIEGRVGLY